MVEESLDLKKCFDEAKAVALKAGKVIREAFFKEKSVETKSCASDLVTETDTHVEQIVLSTLRERFPTHRFIGEESTTPGEKCHLTDEPTWIIDPIDGTTNFVHKFPFTCISIGFLVNKKPEIGIIYNPILDELYSARAGHGAYCNERQIKVTNCKDYQEAIMIIDTGACTKLEDIDTHYENVKRIKAKCRGIRSIGSAALSMCMVARGVVGMYFEFGIHCWDIAAGWVIVEEAGGVVLSPDGSPLDVMGRCGMTAANKQLALDVIQDVKPVNFPKD